MRPLFSETSVAAVRLIVAVTFSVATIFIDSRFDALTMVRQAIKTALWPVEQIAYLPGDETVNPAEAMNALAAAVTIDFKVEDNAGNRVVLSTDGSITGYTNGKRTPWEPILNEHQLSMMESGQGTRVA
ncbi:MAG: hypothetical protein EBW06_02340, partial [Gammaproteobacteria bacterium]|nr:hypothetical protein [Gammaproteobacteria bacterium]